MELDPPIGERIKYHRRRRGMSQEVCAGLVGRSPAWLSQIERGARPIDRLSMLLELARVLRVRLLDLIGTGLPADASEAPPPGGEPAFVADLRAVLMRYESISALLVPDGASRYAAGDEARIRRGVVEANRLYQVGRYAATGELLTDLLMETQAMTSGLRTPGRGTSRAAFGLLAEVYHVTAKTLSRVGEAGLAWIVAERAVSAAERSESSLLMAATAYHLSQALLRQGCLDEALSVAVSAADALERADKGSTQEWLSVTGGLHLTAAIVAAEKAEAITVRRLLTRAEHLAEQLGEDRNDLWLAFGRTNVEIHRVAAAVELGDPSEAIRRGEAIQPARLPGELLGRRSQLLVELARAYAQRRADDRAVRTLLHAESVAPEAIRSNGAVRDVINDLLARPRRRIDPDLQKLADRVGVLN